MRYFGRSQKEQFNEYKAELEKIERQVFQDNYKEMLRLLELTEDAYPYDARMRDDGQDDERSMDYVQKRNQEAYGEAGCRGQVGDNRTFHEGQMR